MKDKKGFTLVELLAVIAILAILVLIAIPNVLNLYRNARKNTFVDEVQNIVRTAQQKYIEDSMNNGSNLCYDSKTNPLDIDARSSLNYKVQLSNDGKITSIEVLDNNYQLIKTNQTDIKRDSIKNDQINSRDKDQGLTDCKGNTIIEGTTSEPEGEQGIQYTSMLKNKPFNRFFDGDNYEYNIESIKFVNTNSVPDGVLGSEDVTNDNSGDIMMWWTDTNNDGNYEVTIGGEGGVRANTNSSYLFASLTNLTSIDLTCLDTSEVTNMEYMFGECSNLTTLDLSNFDTSQVTDMSNMFYYCTSLTDLDLSSFDTSQVKEMDWMFTVCGQLSNLKLSDKFIINDDTEICLMFAGTDSLEKEPYVKFIDKYQERLNDSVACHAGE